MEPISSIVATGLSTFLGKLVAGAAVTAVGAAGMHGAGVVDLPLPDLEDKPAVVVTDDEPAEQADEAKALAEEKKAAEDLEDENDADADEISEAEETEDEADESETAETGGDDESGEPNANAAFGQEVAEDARDGGVDGRAVAAKAPGAEHRPGHAGAPAEPGSQAPAEPGSQADDVRQDGSETRGDDTDETETEVEEADTDDEGVQAEGRPADAGTAGAANGNRP